MSGRKDFAALHQSGEPAGASYAIGAAVGRARDGLACGLAGIGVTPNGLTFAGFVATVLAAACLLRGAGFRTPWEGQAGAIARASWWPIAACVCLFIACACDMLDGAVARIGRMASPFGGVLDSTLDRFSDFAIYLACAVHFGLAGNLTCNALAVVALCNAYLISYVKARSENLIDDCSVGFWLRGERCGAWLLGLAVGHVPALLWQQAVWPLFTVIRRVRYTAAVLAAEQSGTPLPNRGPLPGWRRYLAPWRFPRGSVPYDLVAGFHAACLVAVPWLHPFFYGDSDPLRRLLESV